MMGGHLDQQNSHNQNPTTICVEFSQSVETAPPSSPLIHKIGKGVSLLVPDGGWQRFAPATFNNPQITKSSPRQKEVGQKSSGGKSNLFPQI